jgi:ABC-type multidrug transport system fused ATPase/permease subunit
MSETEKTGVLENLQTVRKAFGYTLRFAWKSAPRLTALRLCVAAIGGVIAYLMIYIMGQWFNAMQMAVAQKQSYSFTGFLVSDVVFWVLAFAGIMLVRGIINLFDMYIVNVWNKELAISQQMNILRYRETFDIARCRSKELDDLEKEIENLDYGWEGQRVFAGHVLEMLQFLFPMIGSIVALWQVQPYYAIAMFIFFPLLVSSRIRLKNKQWALNKGLVPLRKEVGILVNAIDNSNPWLFNMAKQWLQALFLLFSVKECYQNIKGQEVGLIKTRTISELGIQVLMILVLISVLLHATWAVLLVGGAIGTMSVILNSCLRFMDSLQMLSQRIADQWFSAKGVILLEEQFFQLKPVLEASPNPRSLEETFHELRLENVDFVYPNDTDCLQVLNGVNLTIRAGEKVAIIGENGSGKSSTLSLFLREYDPCAGRVLVNGINLRELKLEEWFSEVVKVSQGDGDHISRRKVGEEIASSVMGQPVDEALVWQVLRIVRLEEEVQKLPKLLATQIGEDFGGRDFSGGIRQRFAIARALYRVLKLKASVFIGDELDTGVDANTADQLMDELLSMDELTFVFVTHNLGQHLERCDRIFFFEKGKLIGAAPHARLLKENEAYRKLVEKDQKRRSFESSAPSAAAEAE